MQVAKNITRARQAAGLTQAELARRLKKSRSSVQEYEAGEHQPRLAVLEKIAKICSVRLSELVA